MRGVRESLLGLGASALVCSGCAPEPQPAGEPARVAEDAPASSVAAPATDSSLAIKRGIMSLTEDRVTFTPCNAQNAWWVLDQSPGLQTQSLVEGAQSPPAELYVEAYGERTVAVDEPQAAGFEAVFVLEEVLYAGVPGEVRGCDAPDATYIVTARGNEPFWSVEIRDDRAIWRQPSDPQEIVFDAPQTQNAEGAVNYSARVANHALELMVHAQPCRDSMSGEFFAFTARAKLDGTEFNGCARVGR